jgi:hypothetical protein
MKKRMAEPRFTKLAAALNGSVSSDDIETLQVILVSLVGIGAVDDNILGLVVLRLECHPSGAAGRHQLILCLDVEAVVRAELGIEKDDCHGGASMVLTARLARRRIRDAPGASCL